MRLGKRLISEGHVSISWEEARNPGYHSPIPQKPFEPVQVSHDESTQCVSPFAVAGRLWETCGRLLEDCEPHRDMEPIEQALRLRVPVELEVADSITTIREKSDPLVQLAALRLEHFEQAMLRFLVNGLDEGKALNG